MVMGIELQTHIPFDINKGPLSTPSPVTSEIPARPSVSTAAIITEVFSNPETEFPQQVGTREEETKEITTSDSYFYIKVRPGDNLWHYHLIYGVPMDKLYEAMENAVGHRKAEALPVGTRLLVEAKPTRAPFARLQIPSAENEMVPGSDSLFIEPLYQMTNTGGWKEPNHGNAWILAGFPQVIFLHRNSYLGSHLSSLIQGDEITLYRNIDFTDPTVARVVKTEIIDADEQNDKVLWQANGNSFALVTCHPPGNETAPERLVIWLKEQ